MTRHLSHNETLNSVGSFIDIGQLKALSVTSLPNSTWAYVEAIGEYYLDTTSTAIESIPDILAPNSGSGRWIKKSITAASDYAVVKQLSNLQTTVSTQHLTLNFIQLETFVFTQEVNYKITSVSVQSGVTATIKLAGTATNYTMGSTVNAFDKLDITVNTPGAITIHYSRL